MDQDLLRAWWFERQGLAGLPAGVNAADVLAATGWARSVGGATPYLTLFARAGLRRPEVDAALEAQEIHELPSARGCTYVVPRADYALALTVGQGFGEAAALATARKFLGVTDAEIDRLMERVVEELAGGPLDPRDLKAAVGDASRNLGAEGKKRGTTTTLPLALGKLQSVGRIRRIPVGGRLDQQRYRYAVWSPSPLEGSALTREEALTELARRYFRWTGPASLANFQWFSGSGVQAVRAAVAPLDLVPLEPGFELLMLPDDRAALDAYRVPAEPCYALVGSMDGVLHLRRDLRALLADADREWKISGDRGLHNLGSLSDLSSHAILDRGRLIGVWEFDPAVGELVWAAFSPGTAALEAAVARTQSYIRADLGDARTFSLDSPESRKPRLDALRGAR